MAGRILLFSDIFPPKTGGSGRWFWEIYSRLPREEVLIAAGRGAGAEAFDKTHDLKMLRLPIEMRTRGIRSFSNLKHYLKLASMVGKIVKREKITAIHCARNLPEGFMAYLVQRRRGTKYLCYVHGEDVGVSSTSRELAWMTRRVFAGASMVVANSNNTRNMLLKEWNLPEAKVRLLYPGVDTKRFSPVPASETERAELGWTGRKVLLTVGRLQKRKGHDCLIKAVKTIREKHPDVLYAILGDGEELPHLKKLVESEGVADHVQFVGEVTDAILMRCYQQCDLFVLPNRTIGKDFEGFGMVLLEAQACGKPVVAGASGGTAETMQIPETGRVVNCDTPEPLAKLLIEMLDNPAELKAMGERGRQWVCDRFDWDALSRQAASLFAEV
ncbi:glycosyltransferase family 4 protein [Zavarzinella formosa]|uniref:glycosyltransferase family 4 protein n=1 Tax=Zavarzinella formosa TaxID=360055 RepID=UPI000495372A|nr:glycosyltransferase family 4 protein [Zavarzinella formosa]